MGERILYLTAVITAVVGAYMDIKYHKIYNKLTIPAMAAGLCMNLVLFGLHGWKESISGLMMGFFFGIFWILGMLKAGDIKLYMAMGAIAGWRFCGYTMICSVLSGGIAALCVMVLRKNGWDTLKRLKLYLLHLLYTKKFVTYEPASEKGYFSFGCCILLGAVFSAGYLWMR